MKKMLASNACQKLAICMPTLARQQVDANACQLVWRLAPIAAVVALLNFSPRGKNRD